MTRCRCKLRRAETKSGRKGRCIEWSRPECQKKSDAKKVFVLGAFAGKRKPRRRPKRSVVKK